MYDTSHVISISLFLVEMKTKHTIRIHFLSRQQETTPILILPITQKGDTQSKNIPEYMYHKRDWLYIY